MDDNYIPLDQFEEIKHGTKLEEHYYDINDHLEEMNKKCIPIYQIQSSKNTNNAQIIQVGIMETCNDILIKTIELFDDNKYTCHIVSQVYDYEGLKNCFIIGYFQFIKIIICKKDTTIPIAKLCYNITLNSENSKEVSLSDYNKYIVNGYFSITLHFVENYKNKMIQLKKYQTFCGHEKILEKLLKRLIDHNVVEILDKLA